MSVPKIDARGLSCPQPVILAKQAAAAHDAFTILLDNEVSKENVLRFAANNGFAAEVRAEGGDIAVVLTR